MNELCKTCYFRHFPGYVCECDAEAECPEYLESKDTQVIKRTSNTNNERV